MKHLSTLLILLFCSSYLAHATDPCIGFGAGFTFDIDDATQTTTFINQATGNYGNNIQWSFYDNGNTTYSSDINPVYTPQGDFFVCMDIWSYWCYSSTCKWIVLSDTVPPCQANFEYAANNNNVLGINFTDQSSNYFVTDPQGNQITLDYLWDFGDGQTATDPNPVHDYTSAGIYTVCLYINNPFTNCGDTTCYNVPVNVPTCQANFDYQISYDQSDGIYHADFNNTSYSLVTGATVTYLWDFGDGQSSVQLNPTHVYTNPGQYTACLSIFVQDNAGAIVCTDSTCYNLVINTCNASFDYIVDNNGVNFSDFSTTDAGQINAWLWNFDDGLSSFEQNPTHLYTAPGTYNVCLTITTSLGCTDTTCQTLTVATCQANFIYTLGENDGVFAAFTNTSTTNPVNPLGYFWDFGDGTNTTAVNPTHFFETGTYQVCLTIYNSDQFENLFCSDQICQQITIPPNNTCAAVFEYTLDSQTATFNNLSNSTYGAGFFSTYQWVFGDGTTSAQPNPTHNYTAAGTYQTCLTILVQDNSGAVFCQDSTCQQITIPPNNTCAAAFEYTLDSQTATFNNLSNSTYGAGFFSTYQWVFGDGTTSAQPNPTHNYTAAGTYQTCLTILVQDNSGAVFCQDSTCQQITIPPNNTCAAAFEDTLDNQTATFNNLSNSTYGAGFFSTYQWVFGDGTTSAQPNPTHNYTAAGTYQTCLTILVQDNSGAVFCQDSTCQQITIPPNNTCTANFDFVTGYNPTADTYFADFTNTSTAIGGTLSYQWVFGDGTTSTQTNPSHVFNSAGVYNVCLTINVFVIGTSIPICTDQICQPITIGSCSAAFEYVGGQVANQFVFQDFSFTDLGTVTAWAWDFGDGTTSTEQFPVHDFAPGTYNVCQTITTSWGCTSTWCDEVTVTGCVADFDFVAGYDQIEGLYYADFTNTSTATGGTLSYQWVFGDGTTSTQTNPSHVFNSAGVYNVCLTINVSVFGIPICTNEVCQTVTVGSCGAAFEYVGGQVANQFVFQDFSFTDLGTVTAWSWDFGDGTTSTEQFPVHDFAPGTYNVCQTITTNWGCTSTWCDNVTVTGCVADFDFVAGYDQIEGLYYADFTNTSTATGGTFSYQWVFGDGTTSTQTNPSHVFNSAGVYNVCLTINVFVIGTSIPICTDQICQPITIGSCSAAFEYVGGQFANQFVFQDFSFTDLGTVTAWAWDFGDGTTSTEQFPVHDFAPGTYNVCQTITTSWGCTSTWCDEVTVTGCVADFDFVAGYDQIEGLYYADFTNTSTATGGTLSYQWVFGDGTTSTQTNPSHVFNSAGVYNVCLTINVFVIGTSIPICTNEVCQTVTVGSCGAAFEYVGGQFANQFVFQDFSFTDLGTVTAWAWDFGDGTTSTEQFPVHDFAPGTYNVCQTITTSWGCTSTWCDEVTVTGCVADFDFVAGYDQIEGLYYADFTNTSTATGGTLSYQWVFGDGTTSTQTNPSHVFNSAGVYNVCLTINVFVIGTSIPICTNEVCQTVTVGSCGAAFEYVGGQFANQFVFQDFSFTDLGTVTAWAWDFGDGTTSTEQSPVHDFAVGTYNVCQTITTNWGCTSTWCDEVTVTDCQASFTYTLTPNDGYEADFISTSTSSGVIDSYFWVFGDGETSTEANPIHFYFPAGVYTACLTITSGGCSNTVCQDITAASCSSDFTASFDNGIYYFNNLSSTDFGTVTSWTWDFGDGNTSTEQYPENPYLPGTYYPCLTITTNWGCTATYCDTIVVNTCTANFDYSYNYNFTTFGLTATFVSTATSSGVIDSYFWDFGDGGTSSAQNPVHDYVGTTGTYDVCLTITSGNCSDIYCQPITLGDCQANFTYTNTDPNTFNFTDLSWSLGGNIIAWNWTFGDGTTSTEQNPQHIYTGIGSYDVCLTFTTAIGCTSTVCQTVSVTDCQANFDYSYNYNFTTFGLTATFVSTATSSGVIDSYFWDFGDGGTSSAQNPVHDYVSTTGTYNVCLTITSGNCADTYCQPITLGDCQANFTYTNTDPNTFNFTDLSWSLGGDIIAWNWTFGDGSTSTGQNPQHVYTGLGSYDVCLTFTTAIGCTSTDCQSVNVSLTPTCNADFNYQTLANGDIQFNDLSTANATIESWSWVFNGVETSSAQNLIYTFVGGFSYDVCLTITTSAGCTETSCQIVFVPPTCAAFFSNEPTATDPNAIAFTDGSTSNNQIVGWLWNFGDNSESEQANPIHTYQQAGTYNVCLTITTANQCSDFYCREIIVGDPCAVLSADFTVTGPILFFNPFLKIFTNTSVGDIDNFVWTFGDGTSDNTNLNPTHTYTAFDIYEACLTISNNAGCTVTHCETIVVAPSAPPAVNAVTIIPNLLVADDEQIVKVIIESTQEQKCTLTSFAINGQYLKQYEVDLITGENEIDLDFTYLSPAVYVVRVQIGNSLPFHEKVFKLK